MNKKKNSYVTQLLVLINLTQSIWSYLPLQNLSSFIFLFIIEKPKNRVTITGFTTKRIKTHLAETHKFVFPLHKHAKAHFYFYLFIWMELNSIQCVSSSDVTDEDEIHHHQIQPQFASSKPRNNVVSSGIHPTTSVHDLLECPVCTNSMYPPIHQVCSSLNLNLWVCLLFISIVWQNVEFF